MATFSKQFLSGSTNGRPIAVAATASPGTTLHTADAADIDEVWLYAVLLATATPPILLTVEFGGTTVADKIELNIITADQSKPQLVVAGQPITNSLLVRAFAATASVVNVWGFVNRIT